MADAKTEAEPRSVSLDPSATLQEIVGLNEVKARAQAEAAQKVEDYLRNRVLVLATERSQLMAANQQMADLIDKAAANEADDD